MADRDSSGGGGIDLVGLPPLVALQVVVVSDGLETAYDRARSLESMGYRVAACGDPSVASRFVAELSPGAVLVEMGRSGAPPAEVLRRLREVTAAPIMVAGCGEAPADLARCLEAGADDATRARPSTQEIDLRLRAIFRRMQANGPQPARSAAHVMRVGEIEIDQAGQVVRKRGQHIPLSPTEFRLLCTLAEHQGEVIPSRALIARVWGTQYASETHYLRLYVRYLRQKLEDDPSNPQYIVNRWGTGYALEGPVRAA
jgi:DNA-binding response OmpR family regulator